MSETVDAAWEALLGDLDFDEDSPYAWKIARHRPLIEAAIRADALREFGGDDPDGAWNVAYERGRAESDERVAALLPVIERIETLAETSALDGHPDWTAGSRASFALAAGLLRAALSDAAPEDADE